VSGHFRLGPAALLAGLQHMEERDMKPNTVVITVAIVALFVAWSAHINRQHFGRTSTITEPLSLAPGPMGADVVPQQAPTYGQFLFALMQVESGGDQAAIGDGGKSRGPYQIQRAYWEEAAAGSDAESWDYLKHVWNPARSQAIMRLHWDKLCPGAVQANNFELLARTHRLPYAPWRKDNDAYWKKVRNQLKKGMEK